MDETVLPSGAARIPVPSAVRASSPGPRPWHALEEAEVLRLLDTSTKGLSDAQAASRLEQVGPNVVQRERPERVWTLLWRQVRSPLIWVLLLASALAIALGKLTDGLVVLAVVVLNTVIGFVQELRAGRAIAALSQLVPERACVIREGARKTLPSAELVPGDLLVLTAGDKVPADLRLLHAQGLQAQEGALTGESLPVDKAPGRLEEAVELGDRSNLCFGGTIVSAGTGEAWVFATGARTELGRIQRLLEGTTELQTPLTRALASIARMLTVAILAVSLALLGVGLWRGFALADALLVGITLAVAAIPEGLPAIVTIALAIGVQRMAARRAVIRHMPAVETLGSTTVICTDKTGTLTANEMTVRTVRCRSGEYALTGGGFSPEGDVLRGTQALRELPDDLLALLRAGMLCSDATLRQKDGRWTGEGDPTEVALVAAAGKAGLVAHTERERFPREDVRPFESEQRFMATLHAAEDGGRWLLLKGAPEVVLPRCKEVDGLRREEALQEAERLAAQGMRVLALAERRLTGGSGAIEEQFLEHGLTLLGLQAMADPPRAEAIQAVRDCRAAGIRVKMITGDHRATALSIGQEIGLAEDEVRVLAGAELSLLDDAALEESAFDTHVFARVSPEHKLRLVRALQRRGHVVAMTGDGVNDAPALKQADIGVAMGITGTSASKDSADMVLADDNFASIAAAVGEGRRVYDNLVKSLAFVLPTNLGLAFILSAGVLFFPRRAGLEGLGLLLPMRPTQVLWINLVATVALALPLAFEAREPDVMRRPPRDPKAPVLDAFVIFRTVLVALAMSLGAVAMFIWAHGRHSVEGSQMALREAQTMAVTTVIFFQIFYLLNCRSLRDSMRSIGLFSNPSVFVGIALLLLLQAGLVYLPPLQRLFATAPLSAQEVALCAALGSLVAPLIGIEKWVRARLERRQRARDAGGGPKAPGRLTRRRATA